MNTGGIGHVFIHHFGQAPSGLDCGHAKGLAKGLVEGKGCGIGLQGNAAAREIVRVQLAQDQIGIGDSGAHPAPPITRRPRFRPCTFRSDTDLLHPVHPRQRPTPCADFHHVDHGDRNGHA